MDEMPAKDSIGTGQIQKPFQFSIVQILVTMFLIAVPLGFFTTRMHLGVFLYFVVLALAVMAVGIARSGPKRRAAGCVLFAALAYVVANVFVFRQFLIVDAFSIFDFLFIALSVVVCPLLAAVVVTAYYFANGQSHWLCLLGFWMWMGCVGFANLFVIGIASASV